MKIKWFLIFSVLISWQLFSQDVNIDMDAMGAAENFRWGVYAYHKGLYNNSISYLEKGLSYKPGDSRIKYWLGKVLYKSGYEEAALNEWNRILDTGEKDPLLANAIQVISTRRGIGEEIRGEERLVITRELDGMDGKFHAFRCLTSVKPKKDGSVFLVAYGTNEIISINANGLVTNVFKGGISVYNHPFDVLQLENGHLLVTEYESDRVAICKPNGDRIRTFGGKGTGEGKFLGPQYLAKDEKDFIYVTDWGNHRVAKFDIDGNFASHFGHLGEKENRLAGPSGIAVIDDRIYVADKIKKAIFIFDFNGNYINKIGEGFLNGPEGLFVKDRNTLYVAETYPSIKKSNLLELNIEQEKFSIRYDISSDASRIMNMAVDANHNLYAVDYNKNKVFILSRMSDLYSGYYVRIERIESSNFPEIVADLSVQNRYGDQVVGLDMENLTLREQDKLIGNYELYKPVFLQDVVDVVVVVEKSLVMKQKIEILKKSIIDLLGILDKRWNIQIVSAGEEPGVVIEKNAKNPVQSTDMVNAAAGGKYSNKWSIDSGIRLAGSRLIPSRKKRAIIYLSSGTPGWNAFKKYSLMETTQFLKNNYISFNVIYLGPNSPGKKYLPEDILFLCEESGGEYYNYYNPKSILAVADNLTKKTDPRYIVKYQSNTFPDFGTKYIELSVELIMNKISGKDQLGYFAPIE